MKNAVFRGLKYLSHKKVKSFMLIVLFIIISGMVLLSTTLNATVSQYYNQLENKNGISVAATPIMDFGGQRQEGGPPAGGMKIPDTTITNDQLKEIKALPYVTDVIQSGTSSVTSDTLTKITYEDSSTTDQNPGQESAMVGSDGRISRGNFDIGGLKFQGNTNLSLSDDFTNETVSLSSGKMPEKDNEILLSQSLADLNGLKVGDKTVLKNSDGSKSEEYTVSGIYTYNNVLDEMGQMTVPENTIYGTYNGSLLLGNADDPGRTGTQFFIENTSDLNQFKKDYFSITGKSASEVELTLNDTVYQNTIKPLEQLSKGFNTVKWVVIGIISAILAIVSYLMIKERNYEIGVLYSLSESKRNIVLQFIAENGILLTISFGIALIFNQIMGSKIINSLMNMDLFSSVKEGASRMQGGGPGMGMGPGSVSNSGATETIKAFISGGDMVKAYVFILIVICVITLLTIGKTLMKRPKEVING